MQFFTRTSSRRARMPTYSAGWVGRGLAGSAHSGDLERLIRSIMNTGSGDHEHPLMLA